LFIVARQATAWGATAATGPPGVISQLRLAVDLTKKLTNTTIPTLQAVAGGATRLALQLEKAKRNQWKSPFSKLLEHGALYRDIAGGGRDHLLGYEVVSSAKRIKTETLETEP
jgi:hypothetical protein